MTFPLAREGGGCAGLPAVDGPLKDARRAAVLEGAGGPPRFSDASDASDTSDASDEN